MGEALKSISALGYEGVECHCLSCTRPRGSSKSSVKQSLGTIWKSPKWGFRRISSFSTKKNEREGQRNEGQQSGWLRGSLSIVKGSMHPGDRAGRDRLRRRRAVAADRRASAARAPGHPVGQPARRVRGRRVPAPAQRLSEPDLCGHRSDRSQDPRCSAVRVVLGGPARRCRRPHRPAARRGGIRGQAHALRRYLGRLPFSECRGL